MWRKLLLGLLVAWAGLALAFESRIAVEGYDRREAYRAGPLRWRFGTPPPERLGEALEGLRGVVPPGSVVAFATRTGPGDSGFFRWRWAAWLLPEYHVVPVAGAQLPENAEYLVTYGQAVSDPRLEPLRDIPPARLFRVKRE